MDNPEKPVTQDTVQRKKKRQNHGIQILLFSIKRTVKDYSGY
jgi:hypothetical protein